MKIFKFVILYTSLLFSPALYGGCISEVGIYTGYAGGNIHDPQENYKVIPLFVRVGFDLNQLFCIDSCFGGRVQLNLEPSCNQVIAPDSGQEVGLPIMFQYIRPVTDSVSVYLEGGAGPIYLSIDTVEQECKGFNFLDQFGVGVRWNTCSDLIMTIGYRWRHISHAGIRDSRNCGINSHACITGFSRIF